MKQILLLFFVCNLGLGHRLYAQNEEFPHPFCATTTNTEQELLLMNKMREMRQIEQQFLTQYHQRDLIPIDYMPIKFHVMCNNNGGNCAVNVADVTAALDTLNKLYLPARIQFYQCGAVNFVNSSNYNDFERMTDEGPMTAAHFIPNVCNAYICNRVRNGGNAVCGYAYYPGGPEVTVIDNGCFTSGNTFAHEMGHFLSVYHPHDGGGELVNGTNCLVAGDLLCDTPADPNLFGNVNGSCVYTGAATDGNGASYNPDTRNIMAYTRPQCREGFTPQQYARFRAAYHVWRPFRDCPTLYANFSVNNRGDCSNTQTVNFIDNSLGATSWQWDVDGDGSIDYTTQNPTHTYTSPGIYDVELTVSDGAQIAKRRKQSVVVVGPVYNLPYSEDFESMEISYDASSFENGWQPTPVDNQISYRWNIYNGFGTPMAASYNGGTPSPGTGPLADNTTGTFMSKFVYTEASNGTAGDVATLVSPCITLNGTAPELTFAYHLFGTDMGTLHIDVHNGTTWINDVIPALSGTQQTTQNAPYLIQSVPLVTYAGQTVRIRFRAVRANGFTGDMAIDDINIADNPILNTDLISFQAKSVGEKENELIWKATSSIKGTFFEIQRSGNAIDFSSIATVEAQQTATAVQQYSYRDQDIQTRKTTYYRLKIVDPQLGVSYSKILNVEGTKKILQLLSVFPNPVQQNVELMLVAENASEADLVLVDALGRVVLNQQVVIREGAQTFRLELSSLSNGVYYLQIRAQGQMYRKKIVKQN